MLVPAGRETKKLPFGDFLPSGQSFPFGALLQGVPTVRCQDSVEGFVTLSSGLDLQDLGTGDPQNALPRIFERHLRRVLSQLANP